MLTLEERFEEHAKDDRKMFEAIMSRLDTIDDKVTPLAEQDERVQWAAKQVVKTLKIILLVLSVIVSAVALWKGVTGK